MKKADGIYVRCAEDKYFVGTREIKCSCSISHVRSTLRLNIGMHNPFTYFTQIIAQKINFV